jgi:Ca-activated chloride channel homolog
MATRLEAEKWTIDTFLRQIVRDEDSVELFAFNNTVHQMLPIDYNWRHVFRTIKNLKPQGETALYDAVSKAAQWLIEDRRPARHVIILLSDGEENASKTNLDQTLTLLLKAGAAVYSVNDGDDQASDVAMQGESLLKRLAVSTGGTYLHAAFDGDVGTAFGRIRNELRSQYAIAYKPSDRSAQGFQYLNVLAGKLYVHCRTGYYAK